MSAIRGRPSPRSRRTATAGRPYERPSLPPTHAASFSGESRPTLAQSYAYPSPQDSSPIPQSLPWTPSHRASYPMPTASHLMLPPSAPVPPPGPQPRTYVQMQMHNPHTQYYPSPAFSGSSDSISPEMQQQQFGFYPQAYPVNPYLEPHDHEYSDWTVGDDQQTMTKRPSELDSDNA